MNRSEIDELLWELARLEEAERRSGDDAETATVVEVPDAVLEAYRAGALSGEETDRLERHLSRSAGDRERLAELAGVQAPPMSKAARRKFLQPPEQLPETPADRRRALPMSPRWLLAAAVAALIVLGAAGILLFPASPKDLPPLPDIEASIQGLVEVRAEPSTRSDFTTAEADTAVTVGVVVNPPRAGLEVGLYVFRPDRSAVVRLPLQPVWETRRKAVFRAPARQLVGQSLGTYKLFAVIGRAEGLPRDRILRPGEGPEEAFAGYDVKVETLRLELIHGVVASTGLGNRDREAIEP